MKLAAITGKTSFRWVWNSNENENSVHAAEVWGGNEQHIPPPRPWHSELPRAQKRQGKHRWKTPGLTRR